MSAIDKLCRVRKVQRCRLCAGRIEIGEECDRWSYLESGEGYKTSHAHPECYAVTVMEKWDFDDWESCLPGDVIRPGKNSKL